MWTGLFNVIHTDFLVWKPYSRFGDLASSLSPNQIERERTVYMDSPKPHNVKYQSLGVLDRQ